MEKMEMIKIPYVHVRRKPTTRDLITYVQTQNDLVLSLLRRTIPESYVTENDSARLQQITA